MRIEEELDGRFRNEYHKGFINLIFTSNYITLEFEHILKAYKLTSQQYNVMRVLRGFKDSPRSIDFLRKRMLDRKSDISRIVDKLYQKKLVERVENSIDRRQKDITLTEDGYILLSKLDECERSMDNLFAHLSENEINTLNNLLDKIRQKEN